MQRRLVKRADALSNDILSRPGPYSLAAQQYIGVQLVTDAEGKQELPLLPVWHDESSFHDRPAGEKWWAGPGVDNVLGKSRGANLMISGYMTAFRVEAYRIIRTGAVYGYWTSARMVPDFASVHPHIAARYPGCQILYFFDNSPNHRALAPDALNAYKLNKSSVSSAAAAVSLRMTEWNGAPQDLNVTVPGAAGKPPARRAKSLVDIVTLRSGSDVDEQGKPWLSYSKDDLVDLVAQYPDFALDMSETALQRKVREMGALCAYLPRYHCELNPIELLWAWLKADINSQLNGNIAQLGSCLVQSLARINCGLTSAWVRRVERYFQAYTWGLDMVQAGALVRALTGHGTSTNILAKRRISNAPAADVDACYSDDDNGGDFPEGRDVGDSASALLVPAAPAADASAELSRLTATSGLTFQQLASWCFFGSGAEMEAVFGQRHAGENTDGCSAAGCVTAVANAVLCDFCPSMWHLECASLPRVPRGLWACPHCCMRVMEERTAAAYPSTATALAAASAANRASVAAAAAAALPEPHAAIREAAKAAAAAAHEAAAVAGAAATAAVASAVSKASAAPPPATFHVWLACQSWAMHARRDEHRLARADKLFSTGKMRLDSVVRELYTVNPRAFARVATVVANAERKGANVLMRLATAYEPYFFRASPRPMAPSKRTRML